MKRRWLVVPVVLVTCVLVAWLSWRDQRGIASYYGDAFQGKPTSSGEVFDKRAMTAAHRTLALGTRVRVTNLENGKSVVVKVNDRGPYVRGRIIDLSEGAAEKLGMLDAGLARVRLTVVDGRE